jgi:hypothetical protein
MVNAGIAMRIHGNGHLNRRKPLLLVNWRELPRCGEAG